MPALLVIMPGKAMNIYIISEAAGTLNTYTYEDGEESASDMWTGAEFTETVTIAPNPAQLNFDNSEKYLYVEFFALVTTGCADNAASKRRIYFTVERATANCELGAELCPFVKHPTIVIPENIIFLIAIIPFLPWLMRRLMGKNPKHKS